jgi:hypothetical protein
MMYVRVQYTNNDMHLCVDGKVVCGRQSNGGITCLLERVSCKRCRDLVERRLVIV